MDMSSLTASRAYSGAASAMPPASGEARVTDAATAFAQTLGNAEMAASAAMTGTGDTQTMVETMTQAQLAVDTAVAIRDKVVEAYQEILRMQV